MENEGKMKVQFSLYLFQSIFLSQYLSDIIQFEQLNAEKMEKKLKGDHVNE